MKDDLRATAILLTLLKNPDSCPHFTQIRLFPKLWRIAQLNKAAYLLDHLPQCQECRQYISPQQIDEIHRYEKRLLHNSLIQTAITSKLQALIKLNPMPIGWYKLPLRSRHHLIVGVDIDLWIPPSKLWRFVGLLLNQNHTLENWHPHEVTLSPPHAVVHIDLHFLVGFPRHLDHGLFSASSLLSLTQQILMHYHTQDNLQTLIPHHQLIILITRFAATDLLKGLRNLHEIGTYVHSNSKSINWPAFNRLTRYHHFNHLANFIILLSCHTFSLPIPKHLKSLTNIPRYRLLLSFHDPFSIARFNPSDLCRTCPHPITQKLESDLSITSQLADLNLPWYTFFKPQIILFALKAIIRQLYRIF